VVLTSRFPVPTSTDAPTRSPTGKSTRVALGRAPTGSGATLVADAGGAVPTETPAATNAAAMASTIDGKRRADSWRMTRSQEHAPPTRRVHEMLTSRGLTAMSS
jgi:hypothetical protein